MLDPCVPAYNESKSIVTSIKALLQLEYPDFEVVVVNDGSKDDTLAKLIDGFLKQGKSSCGVARQYTGSAGKITNCPIGVFAAYVSRHGHAFNERTPAANRGSARAARARTAAVPAPVPAPARVGTVTKTAAR